jgi:PQQ-dependent catabolism-associated CXXCW motif protein
MRAGDQFALGQTKPQGGPESQELSGGFSADDEPYPGLRAFRRDETHIFFGREGAVNEMVDRLAVHRFLAVTGASGSGKSSLVRTGLLDALDRGLLAAAGPDWRVADFRPGDLPLAALTESLLDAIGEASTPDDRAIVDARLARGPLGLVDWLDEIDFPRDANLLLLVDQFEELFRFHGAANQDEAEGFVALLLASAAQRRRPIYVVITMRSDFLGECARFAGLAEAINEGQFLTPRLTRKQCEEAIEGPAGVCGGRVEKALVTRLLNDMGSNPDQLPLMQHVLMLMWEKARRKAGDEEIELTVANYEMSGGIGPSQSDRAPQAESAAGDGGSMGALSDHADRILARLDPAQQQLAAKLFRALVQSEGNIGRDMRRPVSLREVAGLANANPDQLIPVIEAFRAPGRNFLTPAPPTPLEPDTIIDISHESLIRQWRALRRWVQEEFQSAETYRTVEKTAKLWSAGSAGLMTNPLLGYALAWRRKERPNAVWASRYGGNFELAARFLDRSERRRNLRKWSYRAMVGCLLLTTVWFSVYYFVEARRSAAALALAKENWAANWANERSDFNVPAQYWLKIDNKGPTPLTIPGAGVVTTAELDQLIKSGDDLLLIDALADEHELSLPNAWRIQFAGNSGSFYDDTQQELAVRLGNLTANNLNKKIVFFCLGVECWESYNAALRAEHAGYRNILWYRGGLKAWQAWAKSQTDKNLPLPLQSISQTAKALAHRLSSGESDASMWNDAVSLSEAVPVLLALPHPDIQGAQDAYESARTAIKALTSKDPGNRDLIRLSFDNEKNSEEIERARGTPQ